MGCSWRRYTPLGRSGLLPLGNGIVHASAERANKGSLGSKASGARYGWICLGRVRDLGSRAFVRVRFRQARRAWYGGRQSADFSVYLGGDIRDRTVHFARIIHSGRQKAVNRLDAAAHGVFGALGTADQADGYRRNAAWYRFCALFLYSYAMGDGEVSDPAPQASRGARASACSARCCSAVI